jgi:DNA-3-methyladenine glycosylase
MKLPESFFTRDVLEVAPDLIGKVLVRRFENGDIQKFIITETEAYRGEEDLACHASKGRTPRTETMYLNGGCYYVYLIYGMYWMLNVVASVKNNPQAVLIRGIEGYNGPGKLTKKLLIDKSFDKVKVLESNQLWIEDSAKKFKYKTSTRIGIDYAGEIWKNKPWRFIMLPD